MRCPACNADVPAGARFCPECGKPVAAPQGEALQRILTLVFLDLVGSTRLAAESELEAYDDLLARYHAVCEAAIAAYDGRLLMTQGDGVLACFGLTGDSENAALSAAAASLAVLREVPERVGGLTVRAGIHSGMVFCRTGEGGALVPQISGLEVNIAARVQSEAQPGCAVATGATMAFLERIATVEAEDLGAVALKGVPEPTRLWQLRDKAFGPARMAGDPLVEREATLAAVIDDTDQAGAGAPAVSVLVGSPGIGKSAILAEIARRLDNRCRRIDLSARLNLRHTPFHPVADWLARTLGYAHVPLDQTAAADLGRRMRTLMPGLTDTRLALLAGLLGREEPALLGQYAPAQLREMRLGLLVDIVGALMARGPVLLTVDDFHWIDEASLAFLDRLLGQGVPAGTRVVITSRPDAGLADFAARHGLATSELPPLSEAGARALLRGLAPQDLPEETAGRILAMAEGNPLFLRSLLRLYAREGGARGAALPPTIEATFQGLINAIGPARDLLLAASVVGRGFSDAELDWLVPAEGQDASRIEALAAAGIVEPSGGGWQFTHILLQEAAYKMLPASRRRVLHRRFAEAMAARDPARAAAYPEVLADHWLAADAPAEAAGACVSAGIGFLMRASFVEAVRYLEAAVGQIERIEGASRLGALTLLAAARVQRHGFSHPETAAAYRTLQAAARGDEGGGLELVMALYGLFAHRVISGQVRASRALVEEMEAAADPGDSAQAILCLVNRCAHALYSGDLDGAMAAAAALRAAYDPAEHGTLFLSTGADPLISVLTAEANVQGLRGDADAVRASIREALAHADAIGAALQKPWILIFDALALHMAGEEAAAREQVDAGIALADLQGGAFWSLNGRYFRSAYASLAGQPEGGPMALDALIEAADAVGIGLNLPFLRGVRALDLMRAGRLAEADALSRRACRESAATGQGMLAPEVWRARSQVLAAQGRGAEAARALRIAAGLARRSGATVLEARSRGSEVAA
jgi:class 3 adenylate cyclase